MRLDFLTLGLLTMATPLVAQAEWPPAIHFSDESQLVVSGNMAYDFAWFSGDSDFSDSDRLRRSEIGLVWKGHDTLDASVMYDTQSGKWADVFLRFNSEGLGGKNLGRFRLGYFRTPFSIEGSVSSRVLPLGDNSLASQALTINRRLGVDWQHQGSKHYVQAGYFGGKTLDGESPASVLAARALWIPFQTSNHVLHLGGSAAAESLRSSTAEDGSHLPPQLRLRARPGNGIANAAVLDTHLLNGAERVHRQSLEALWLKGPVFVQAEVLSLKSTLKPQELDVRGDGHYVMAGWMVTGETRKYRNGYLANPEPQQRWGAVELLARYDEVEVEVGASYQRSEAWTLSAGWYLNANLRFLLNHSRVRAQHEALKFGPDTTELRLHLQF